MICAAEPSSQGVTQILEHLAVVAGEFSAVDIVEEMEFSGSGIVTRHRCGVIGYGDAVEDADDVLARVALRVAAHRHQTWVMTDDSGFFDEFAQKLEQLSREWEQSGLRESQA